jgi:transposase
VADFRRITHDDVESLVSGRKRVLNGIFWVSRSGAPWRDLPPGFGPYTSYNRFVRWRVEPDHGSAGRRSLRIPEKATTLSGACRPRDPVDDDQGGARA